MCKCFDLSKWPLVMCNALGQSLKPYFVIACMVGCVTDFQVSGCVDTANTFSFDSTRAMFE